MTSVKHANAETLPLNTVSHLAWVAANSYQLPEGSADRLVCIAWHESSFRSDVTSNSGHRGLMQFSDTTYSYYSQYAGTSRQAGGPYNPAAAMDTAAYIISVSGAAGWRHWTPALNGRC